MGRKKKLPETVEMELSLTAEPVQTEEEINKKLRVEINIAFIKAEEALKNNRIPVNVIWSVLLNGLAVKCGSQAKLISQFLAMNHRHEEIASWYLSANTSSQDFFMWLEEAGLTDHEIVRAINMSDPWKNNFYEPLDDYDLIDYILASNWQPARQMAALISADIISISNINYLIKQRSIEWILEMIVRGQCWSEQCYKAIKSITTPVKSDTTKVYRKWTDQKIWEFWDDLGISNRDKITCFMQAIGVSRLVQNNKILSVEEMITELLALKVPLHLIANAYAPLKTADASSDSRILDAGFIETLEGISKSDKEIIELLIGCEFTLHMVAVGLMNANWDAIRILTAMVEAGCDPLLIIRMVNLGAEDFSINNNQGFWNPDVVVVWRTLLKTTVEKVAQDCIFGAVN